VFAVVASGRSCRQVAEALGINYASARQRLARAIASIRRRIAEAAVTV
jgi:DNA-directed RNA polymerase specialized sigma24 family protein